MAGRGFDAMKLILFAGFTLATAFLLVAVFRWASGSKQKALQDLTVEEYRQVQDAASSRRRSER